jgi:hypothetical protein
MTTIDYRQIGETARWITFEAGTEPPSPKGGFEYKLQKARSIYG